LVVVSPMMTVSCRLGLDAEGAALNRAALVLRPLEVADVRAFMVGRQAPTLTMLLEPEGPAVRALGIWPMLALRGELQALLAGIAARQLPDQLVLALTLQRLDTVCGTAQEFGMNLYVTVDGE